jgi:catechol 2,3-dioxygenase
MWHGMNNDRGELMLRTSPHAQPSYGIRPPHRLPEQTHVGGVTLQVSDLQRSVRYYTDVLGMAVLERQDNAARLGVDATGQQLVILQEKRGITHAPRAGRFGLFHFAVLLPDRPSLGRFAAHLLSSGVRPGMADHAVSEALYLTDPDGLGIEVYADRPRSSWTRRGDELVMVTEPLDIADVIAAGKSGAWTEMPDGTVMGHIHLHVGDINAAEAFYHAALGFDKTVWSYPGALFMSAGGYHHHLATNIWSPGPSAREDEARLLEWELVVPNGEEAARVARRITDAGYVASQAGSPWLAVDPWGTQVRIAGASSSRAKIL